MFWLETLAGNGVSLATFIKQPFVSVDTSYWGLHLTDKEPTFISLKPNQLVTPGTSMKVRHESKP